MKNYLELIKSRKRKIIYYKEEIMGYKEFVKRFSYVSDKKKIYLVGTATNGNLGDQAISYSQVLFLSEFKDREIIEITIDEYWSSRKYLKKYVSENDIICIQGGGNMGIEYIAAEESRRDLIKLFPNNKIIIFPQTIDYGISKKGKVEEGKSAQIYSKHMDLHIFAREKYSYEVMKKLYLNNNVYLVPDIVLKYSVMYKKSKRNGALLFLRDDCESIFNQNQKKDIIDIIKGCGMDFTISDTCIDRMVPISKRSYELNLKWEELSKSKLLITDRLHGMVFAALTETPCIIFRNYNKKVEGVYEWIRSLPYLIFIDNIDELEDAINRLSKIKNNTYNPKLIEGSYLNLYKAFK